MDYKDTIFYNADYIVIEYMDLIKSPFLILSHYIRNNPKLKEILKIEEIENLSSYGLYEWYINRKNQNFLIDLNRYPDKISKEELDAILDAQISSHNFFYDSIDFLDLVKLLEYAKSISISNDILIYHPYNNNFAEIDLKAKVGDFKVYKDFNEILDIAGYNSTYFLSNVELLKKMEEKKVIERSSITIPIEYRYNKKDMNNFKDILEEMYKKYTYKLSMVYACSK